MSGTKAATPSVIRGHLTQTLLSLEGGGGGGSGGNATSCAVNRVFARGRPDCLTKQPEGPTQWSVAVLTMGILAVLHIYRLLSVLAEGRPQGERIAREMVIVALGVVGLWLFWTDLHRCRLYEGMLKLVAVVGIANVLLPCVWTVPPPKASADAHDDDDDNDRRSSHAGSDRGGSGGHSHPHTLLQPSMLSVSGAATDINILT